MSALGPIDAFVIFAGPDRDRAGALCHALRREGLEVFSKHDLLGGDIWDVVLPTRLRAARAVVVLISAEWGSADGQPESWYGPEEVALAIALARKTEPPPRLIPVLLDGAVDRTPYGLLRLHAVQVADDAFADAANQIAHILDPTATTPPPPDAADPRRRPPREPDAVTAARERLENLRAHGARAETLDRARADHLAARRAARDGRAPRAGDLFADRYRLIDRLGDGGFATVWLAHDQRRDRRVAVKILHGRWRHDRSRVERFERGARRMAALEHPAVVRVLDAPATHDGWPYYVMEYLPGGDLAAARTRAEDPLTAEQALAAVLTVADALAVAHRRGMVHRDVKPQNILLDADGRAKLSDFDLVGAKDSTGGTRTGALGTFLFAAPEALAAGKDATPAADVYGLAVTTVFALLGQVPAEVVRRPDAVIDALDAPPALAALLRRSLAWSPTERPADAGAFAAEMRDSRASSNFPAARLSTFRPLRQWLRQNWLLAVTSVANVAIVLGAFAWFRPEEPPRLQIRDVPSQGPVDSAQETPEAITSPLPTARPSPGPPSGFVLVPAGTFTMGAGAWHQDRAEGEGSQHQVTLIRPLWVAAHEVTKREWHQIMGTLPSHFVDCSLDCPVEQVNWYEAAEYTNRLSRSAGLAECYTLNVCGPGEPGGPVAWKCRGVAFAGVDCLGYRLPTEAEWEFFARAKAGSRYALGDREAHLAASGWYDSNSNGSPHPVGAKSPNSWGIYDVHGNVWEWTSDRYSDYSASDTTDPIASTPSGYRVIRGGSWIGNARHARLAYRHRARPENRVFDIGFRVVRTAPPRTEDL